MNLKKQFVLMTAVVFGLALVPGHLYAVDTAEMLAQKKAELNGHEWQVKVVPASDPKSGGSEDTLIFKDMKFESMKMTGGGFPSTNYTISLQEGGPSVFETMQSDGKGTVVFWRGEWEGDSMKGVMSKQSEGKNSDYYFSSLSKQTIVEAPKVEVPEPVTEAAADTAEAVENAESAAQNMEAAVPPAVPETVPAQEEEKPKKKKGWF